MLEKAIILASAATMLGIGVLAPSLPGNGKRGEDSAEIAERIGQYDCHSFPGAGVGFEPNPLAELPTS